MYQKHKVFISYHHKNDQFYKNKLLSLNNKYNIFIDKSVDTGDVDPRLSDESIRTKICNEYLRDSTVTIVLVGAETQNRRHVDCEIYSSMHDGKVNNKSGILVIILPSSSPRASSVFAHGYKGMIGITTSRSLKELAYKVRYPYMPKRILDNLVTGEAKISAVPWSLICNNALELHDLIEFAHKNRIIAKYDLTQPMKKQNS